MSQGTLKRRRSDVPHFVQTEVDVDGVAADIFARYAGEQQVVTDGRPYAVTLFQRDYCPDFRVMTLAGRLALAVNQRARAGEEEPDGMPPLRVSIHDIMLAALLHDLGKQHEDCAPFLGVLRDTDLRGDSRPDAARRKEYLLGIVRDVHCRKGPCMIDRLRDGGHQELNNPFFATVARRHGDDYETNEHETLGCWWAREINIVTIADDYDAMTSAGPERAYKSTRFSQQDAVDLLRAGARKGRYEPGLVELFIRDVLLLNDR